MLTDPFRIRTQNRLLSTLRLAVEVYNSKMGSLHVIKTDDIAEWFTHNGTYKFLHRNNLTDKVSIWKWSPAELVGHAML